MSFVEAFYSFSIDISNADSGVSAHVRVKIPRHPFESLEFLYARVLAFVHAYESDLRFSQGLYEPEEPTLWKRDSLGNVLTWIEVGALESRKLKQALRLAERERREIVCKAYLFSDEHLQHFCRELRGAKENWIEPVQFFRIRQESLDAIAASERSSARWTVTVVDSSMYLNCDGIEVETTIEPIDMWDEFQRSINNAP
jgi:uncharacterized protein YaeQ